MNANPQKSYCKCGAVALYRVDSSLYCKAHRADAEVHAKRTASYDANAYAYMVKRAERQGTIGLASNFLAPKVTRHGEIIFRK